MSQSPPTISVITGYYNRAAVVERTLQSLLKQTQRDFEIIVFDDASSDNTAQTIRDFVEKTNDSRIIPIYHKTNTGFVAGLIDAISRARGKYIAIQGSGDISFPRRLELQSELLNKHPEVGVVGCYYENVIKERHIHRLRKPNAEGSTLESVAHDSGFSHGEVMIRRSYYEQAGGYRIQFEFCQDHDLWLRMIKICQFATVKELLYTRFIDFEGASYKPEKFLAQTQFCILAQKLSILSINQQEEILKGVSRQTLSNYVPINNWSVQKKVIRAILRAVVWGNNALATELINSYIVCRFLRIILRLMVVSVDCVPFLHRIMTWVTGSRSAT